MNFANIVRVGSFFLFWVCVSLAAVWAIDNRPPFRLESYEPVSAKRGEIAKISAKVERDLRRECSVKFTRYLFDSAGYRYELGQPQELSVTGLRQVAALSPDELRVSVLIPERMATGTALYMTDLQYVCNPFHVIRPVSMTMEIRIEVLP